MPTLPSRFRRPLGLAFGASLLLASLPGCIVWEIRDELVAVNEGLGQVQHRLDAVDQTNIKLDHLQAQLEDLQAQLKVLDSINASLASVDTTLKSLDRTLASVLNLVRQIDGAIPFLRFTDDEEDEPAAEPDQPPEAPGD